MSMNLLCKMPRARFPQRERPVGDFPEWAAGRGASRLPVLNQTFFSALPAGERDPAALQVLADAGAKR
jgi:hypothetical protein